VTIGLTYRTTNADAVDWFLDYEARTAAAEAVLTRFESDVTVMFGPMPGTDTRPLAQRSGHVIGVRRSRGEPTPNGLRENKAQEALVPNPATDLGRRWKAYLRTLPSVPDHSEVTDIGVPWQAFADGSFQAATVYSEEDMAGDVVAICQEWSSAEAEPTCLLYQAKHPEIEWVRMEILEPLPDN
jgi:hypothetical protein